jgi:outer membrane lipoprotein-sorting protein
MSAHMKQSFLARDRRAVAFAAALILGGATSPAAAQSLWERIISPFQTQQPQPAPAPVPTTPAPAAAPAGRTAPAARQAAPAKPVQILPPGSVPNAPAAAPAARAARPAAASTPATAAAPAAPVAVPAAQAEAAAAVEPSWPARIAVVPPRRPAETLAASPGAASPELAAAAPEVTPAPKPVVTAAVTPTVAPQPQQQAPLTERGIIERANAYFTSMTTMVAKFTQIGADGRRLGGTLFLQRPGRLRFDYDPPATMQVIADGSNVAVRDRKLATQDLYFISQTPLKFLLRERVNLGEDIRVIGVQNERDGVRISLEDRSTLGGTSRITLYFDGQMENLQQWRITDAQGFQTTVILNNVEKGRPIDQSAFKIEYNNPISDNNR